MNFKNFSKFNFRLIAVIIFIILITSCTGNREKTIEIKGIYGHPQPFLNNGYNLPELGVNAIFVHGGSVNHDLMQQAKSQGIKVFAEFATLNGKNYIEEHPEAWAINEKGEKVEPASWFMGVCPTEPGFREYRFSQLRQLITEHEIGGVWMDYVHWHAQFEEPEPILPETCFCDHCLSSFSEDTKIDLPAGSTAEKADWILKTRDQQWRDWRCKVINDWVLEIRKIMDEIRPGLLLGLYNCPWTDEEFNGARRRILGLDYDLLRENIDVFSPMVYHGRMGRSAGWVEENITWFCERMKIKNNQWPKVWPIVQAYDNPSKISAEEFETVLKGGLSSCSSGVMMFTSRAVAEDSTKTEVMKKVYTTPDL